MMQATEIWKPIRGYEGLYEVSNLGKVRSLKRTHPKILQPYTTREGYVIHSLYKKGIKERESAHRLVALAFIPNPKEKRQVNHKDGNKANNVVGNLEWCTPAENIRHAITRGLKKQHGEYNCNAKLTPDLVRQIKAFKPPYTKAQRELLANRYKVSVVTIENILYKRTWRHID